jgi:CysZ protein
MALGLLPAAVVATVAMAGLVVLATRLGPISEALTPFADGWSPFWLTTAHVLAGTAVLGAAIAFVVVTFTALTLALGDPVYERIWRAVEADLGGPPPGAGPGFWRGLADGARLVGLGLLAALVAGAVGLLPAVGSVLGAVVGVLLTGWLLADELTSRALTARGLDRRARRALLRAHRPRVLGFGVAVQLCFLVPLGTVATMPAAVAGATALSRDLMR